jgi:hypothetical protein
MMILFWKNTNICCFVLRKHEAHGRNISEVSQSFCVRNIPWLPRGKPYSSNHIFPKKNSSDKVDNIKDIKVKTIRIYLHHPEIA